MKQRITVLGSTGSIGTSTLDVVRRHPGKFEVFALSAATQVEALLAQCLEFQPRYAVMASAAHARLLAEKLQQNSVKTVVLQTPDALETIASHEEVDAVMGAIVGAAGLAPCLAAARAGKRLLLANKEALVVGGALFMETVRNHGCTLLPIDSEHSAIFQCLAGNRREDAKKIILTASGGPFRGFTPQQMRKVTPEQALRHPNWSMGDKITIDSASLMNKGLEVIEAMWLFGMKPDDIEVVIHKESIIHSMVEFVDGSVMAQLGAPDMRIPIQLALTWPERAANSFRRISLTEIGSLTFEKPDMEAFPCLGLAYRAAGTGGTLPAAMNAANEVAVASFLKREIGFCQIPEIIGQVMEEHRVNTRPSLDDIIDTDLTSREMAADIIRRYASKVQDP